MAAAVCSLSSSYSNSLQISPKKFRHNPPTKKSLTKLAVRAKSQNAELPQKCSKALAAAAAICVILGPQTGIAEEIAGFSRYYGTAASAANYGGYGGNASKKDSAEYIYDVPQGWKERLVSKVEKGTNGTDSEFYNPKRKAEKEYLTFLAGFRTLAPMDTVLNNLSLSDVNLQDIIASASSVKSSERSGANGQVYYDFEIDSPMVHSLISVTCAKNKLYAHFVNAPLQDWARDEAMLKHIHESFSTVGTTDSA